MKCLVMETGNDFTYMIIDTHIESNILDNEFDKVLSLEVITMKVTKEEEIQDILREMFPFLQNRRVSVVPTENAMRITDLKTKIYLTDNHG